jgi:hypothetical protein
MMMPRIDAATTPFLTSGRRGGDVGGIEAHPVAAFGQSRTTGTGWDGAMLYRGRCTRCVLSPSKTTTKLAGVARG